MDKTYETFLVDVLSVAGGIPSSGGLRGENGCILTQYCHPRSYKPHSFSKWALFGLGVASGMGLLALGVYGIYKLCAEETRSSSACDQTEMLQKLLESLDSVEKNRSLMEQNDISKLSASYEAIKAIRTKSNVTPIFYSDPSATRLAE